MSLADGAEAIAGDLPRSALVRIDVPIEAGDSLATGVRRASALQRVQHDVATAITNETDRVIVIGGDCAVAIPAIEHVAGDDLAVVWFDAHADLNDAATSPSGAFAGMAARALIEEMPAALGLSTPLAPGRLILAGARSFDEAEAAFADGSAVHVLTPAALADQETLVAAVRESGASRIYIHVDLDVLDPAAVTGVQDAVPFGLSTTDLTGSIAALRAEFELAGASVSGFAPASAEAAVEDLGTILRVIGALAKA